ncbi:hypothetical protein HYC85_029410 [Camellia sinensis]|uniref:Uncharacterized protein n=1 Tax=Camellia sinensis TaxID=4442 RepID=A0A7J7FY52_CAMSI|nr:hypothetical protein HYC85_029410 [Camellia sinensis]
MKRKKKEESKKERKTKLARSKTCNGRLGKSYSLKKKVKVNTRVYLNRNYVRLDSHVWDT